MHEAAGMFQGVSPSHFLLAVIGEQYWATASKMCDIYYINTWVYGLDMNLYIFVLLYTFILYYKYLKIYVNSNIIYTFTITF